MLTVLTGTIFDLCRNCCTHPLFLLSDLKVERRGHRVAAEQLTLHANTPLWILNTVIISWAPLIAGCRRSFVVTEYYTDILAPLKAKCQGSCKDTEYRTYFLRSFESQTTRILPGYQISLAARQPPLYITTPNLKESVWMPDCSRHTRTYSAHNKAELQGPLLDVAQLMPHANKLCAYQR